MKNEFDYQLWNSVKDKLKTMYPKLTKADLIWRHGSNDDLLDMIANKLGKTAKELQQEIDSL